jgi:hypothetical protein
VLYEPVRRAPIERFELDWVKLSATPIVRKVSVIVKPQQNVLSYKFGNEAGRGENRK